MYNTAITNKVASNIKIDENSNSLYSNCINCTNYEDKDKEKYAVQNIKGELCDNTRHTIN